MNASNGGLFSFVGMKCASSSTVPTHGTDVPTHFLVFKRQSADNCVDTLADGTFRVCRLECAVTYADEISHGQEVANFNYILSISRI